MTDVFDPAHSLFSKSRNLGLAAALLLLTAACSGKPAEGGPGGAAGGREGGAPAMPVEIVTLAPKPVEQTGEFVGTVRSRSSTTIQPQVEGIVTGISVRSGDKVAPGKLLFTIDSTPQDAALASLQSQRGAQEADAQFARQQAQRSKSLLDAGAGSKQEYDQAQSQLKAAEAQLTALDEQIRQQKAQLAFYRVVSPREGTIGDIPVRQGDLVTKTTRLTTVDDNRGLEILVNVPVQQAPLVKVGQPLRLLDDSGKLLASEKVEFVSPSVDETQTVLVKGTLPERAQFRSDQFVRAQIVLKTSPTLTVPVISVTRINGQFFAYVAEPTGDKLIAHQRPIVLGQVVGNDYVVVSGLKAGEKLIVGGLQKIGDGAPVMELPSRGAQPPPAADGRGGERGRGGE
jgi:RND family efflux transporter MFP subunit